MSQKYFIDVHDLESGTFNEEHMSEEGFVRAFAVFDETAEQEGVTALRAHVNVHEGKAYCYTKGADPEAVRRAHEKSTSHSRVSPKSRPSRVVPPRNSIWALITRILCPLRERRRTDSMAG